jgi:hypothetical protein
MRSARLSSLLPSRSETRNRHFGFLQIRNSSKREAPLRVDSLRTGRVGDGREFSGWRRTPDFFPSIKFNPIKRLQSYTLHPQRQGIRAITPDAVQARTLLMKRLVRCVQSRKLRTANHVWPGLFYSLRHAPPVHAYPATNKPGLPAQDCAPFPRDWSTIGSTK